MRRNKQKIYFGVLFYVLLFFIGDRFSVTIKVRRRRYFIVLGFTVVSRCVLGNGRHGNLEHRRRGGESVLRTACDTRASTRRQTVFSSSSSSLLFVVCSTFYYCKIIVIFFSCAILNISIPVSVMSLFIIIIPIFI